MTSHATGTPPGTTNRQAVGQLHSDTMDGQGIKAGSPAEKWKDPAALQDTGKNTNPLREEKPPTPSNSVTEQPPQKVGRCVQMVTSWGLLTTHHSCLLLYTYDLKGSVTKAGCRFF